MGYFRGKCILTTLTVVISLPYVLCEKNIQSTKYVGIVGNKQYFGLRDKQNWIQAKTNCDDSGFKLATIRGATELEFLKGKYSYEYFHGWHWIAARDSRKIKQFEWDHGNQTIDIEPNLIADGTFNSTTTFLTCGAFQINEKQSGVSMVDCTKDNGYALCELEM